MSEKEIWEKVLEIAQEKLSAVSYSTFLKDTELYTIKDGEAIVLSSIPFNANWLNQQYAEIIQAILFDVVGYEVKPHFITTEELANYSNNETA
ncbi:TPA: chromosomal replication initiator protein DnaA, partial [Staphylococcus aureus]|nr:chromosomal replication initiator protein DnaA [Staphylococcus aureus]